MGDLLLPTFLLPSAMPRSRIIIVLVLMLALGAGWYFRGQLGLGLKSNVLVPSSAPPVIVAKPWKQEVNVSSNLALFSLTGQEKNLAVVQNISFNNANVKKVSIEGIVFPSGIPENFKPLQALSISFKNEKNEQVEAPATVELSVLSEGISEPAKIKLYHLAKNAPEIISAVKVDKNIHPNGLSWDMNYLTTSGGVFVLMMEKPPVALPPAQEMKNAAPTPEVRSTPEQRSSVRKLRRR